MSNGIAYAIGEAIEQCADRIEARRKINAPDDLRSDLLLEIAIELTRLAHDVRRLD